MLWLNAICHTIKFGKFKLVFECKVVFLLHALIKNISKLNNN